MVVPYRCQSPEAIALVLVKSTVVDAVIVVCPAGVPVMMAVPPLPVRTVPALTRVSADHVPEPRVRVILLPLVADGVRVTE